jgi:hypothetical protein
LADDASLDRGALLFGGALVRGGLAQLPYEDRSGRDGEDRLDHQQPLDMAVAAEGRAEQQRQQHSGEARAGADRDPGRPLLDRQIVRRQLADRVEDQRLGDREGHLSRHRPAKVWPPHPQQAAERDQPAPPASAGRKPASRSRPAGSASTT